MARGILKILSHWTRRLQARGYGKWTARIRMDHMKTSVLAGLMAVSCIGVRAADLQLQAGVAKVEITPSAFGPMYGYANRKCGPANGKHDPLFAKALVLRVGDSRIAIVTLDLGSVVSENLNRDVATKLGIPVLLLSASHTHSGPEYLNGSSP